MNLHYLTFVLIILLGFISCNKDKDTTPESVTKANIIGSVNLYNEGVIPIDNSNMTIKVEGTGISSKTDIDGNFTLLDVPFGTYTLIYEKSGFGKFKKFNIKHTNTGSSTIITSAPSLGEVSTTQITSLTTNVNGDEIILSVTTDPAGNNSNTRFVRYFLSTDSNVTNENYAYFSPGLISQINPFETTLSQNILTNAGFSSGQTVYVKVYGDSFWSNEYDDPDLNRKIFPNLNITSANSVSFIVP